MEPGRTSFHLEAYSAFMGYMIQFYHEGGYKLLLLSPEY